MFYCLLVVGGVVVFYLVGGGCGVLEEIVGECEYGCVFFVVYWICDGLGMVLSSLIVYGFLGCCRICEVLLCLMMWLWLSMRMFFVMRCVFSRLCVM